MKTLLFLTGLHLYLAFVCLQVLELLLATCAVPGLRSLLCEVVFRPAGAKLRVAGRRQGAGPDLGCKGEAGLALLQWLSSPVDGAESCSLQALQLLSELLEVRLLDPVQIWCFCDRLTVSLFSFPSCF